MSAESPIIDDNLRKYIDLFGYNESELLKRNREETKKLGSLSIMQVGAAQGAFLSIICKVSNFKSCLEVGIDSTLAYYYASKEKYNSYTRPIPIL